MNLIAQYHSLQQQLYELAQQHELTDEAVVLCSRELDEVVVQLQRRRRGDVYHV